MTAMLERTTESVVVSGVPRRSRWRLVVGIVVAAVLLASAAGFAWLQWRALPAGAALAVGDDVVTVSRLDERMQTLDALYGVKAPTDPARLDGFRRDSAKAVAVSTVLDREAAQRGIVVPDPKARDTLNSYVQRQLGDGPQAYQQFVQILGNVGTSEGDVLDEIKRQFAVAELYAQVTGPVNAADADLQAEFPRYAAQLGVPEKRRLSNIVVTDRGQADRIVAQLRTGAPFADLARQFSIDGSSRDAGGDIGEVTAAQLQDGFGKAAFAAPVGQPFGPVQNQFGWNVGLVAGATPGQPAQFERVLPQLRQLVEFDRKSAAWNGWLADALRTADIRYAPDYTPADPDGAPQVPAATPGG